MHAETCSTLPEVIYQLRPALADVKTPSKQRIRTLWASAKQARGLAEDKVVADAFMQLTADANLINRAGSWTGADVAEYRIRYGGGDVAHVISWALRGMNPFEKGPLL